MYAGHPMDSCQSAPDVSKGTEQESLRGSLEKGTFVQQVISENGQQVAKTKGCCSAMHSGLDDGTCMKGNCRNWGHSPTQRLWDAI